MTPPNPLQELAEKIRLSRGIAGWDQGSQYESILLELLTASVGTLLQAERAATIELILNKKRELYEIGSVQSEAIQFVINCLSTSADASALSAVVQRDTEKLRELLHRAHGCVKALQIEAKRDGYTLAEVNRLSDDIKAALQ